MAPHTSESSILESYLLPPASLPNIVSSTQFQQLLPASIRSHPHIKTLYRDLQFLRSVDVDVVRENIAAECKKAPGMKTEMLRTFRAGQASSKTGLGKRKRDADDGLDENARIEVAMDNQFFGPTGMVPRHDHYHNPDSLLAEMETACESLEKEVEATRKDADIILAAMKETVGGLSDLRYGKFAKMTGDGNGLEKSVVDALRSLESVCEQKSK